MRINKEICPVCTEKRLTVTMKKKFGITVRCCIRCRYCCHHAEARTERKAYKNLWENALNEEELKGESLYV